MVISYKKLWKLLIDRDMKKKDLIAKSGISQSSVTKLGHNESVSTDIIVKICTALECDLTDIMELVPEEKRCGTHVIIVNIYLSLMTKWISVWIVASML